MSNKTHTQPPSSWNFNYWITKIFLENSRLTILSLILLILVGVFTGLSLKTTGFPSPEIGIVLVQTVYPGASSETITKEVTIPLEGAIKNVDGVKRFNSTSSNSFSNIAVTIDEKANSDSVRNKIDSAVKSVTLPDGAESPKTVVPSIGGPDLILAISNKDVSKIYETYEKANQELTQLTEVSSVSPVRKLDKKVVIRPDLKKLSQNGLSTQDVESQLASLGESIPAVSNVTIDGKNAGISTSIKGDDLQSLKDFPLLASSAPAGPQQASVPSVAQNQPTLQQTKRTVKLSDVATISTEYRFEGNKESKYAFHNNEEGKVLPAVVMEVKAVSGTDQGQFIKKIEESLDKIDGAEYVKKAEINKDFKEDKTYIVEAFAVNDDNKEQVDQVIGGVIGSKIGDSPIGYLGYLLGGIQLVVLVMIAFVSWRAALIAATAIPLSLIFSTIYVYLIGENLNTLVLFSLVLVIGLVVDPALVILEAIQRKIDTGLKGKEAVLAAVKDVGNGIFLAALTNIIVFVPFGVLSGIFGQIFAYIPLTVIPAIVGSYIVPLVFLAWLGSIFLKPNKNGSPDEEKNLWGIAKGLIKLNYRILTGSRWFRFLIIVVGFIVPMALTIGLISTGKIKQVQFAQSDDSEIITLDGSFLPAISKENQDKVTQDVLEKVSDNENVTAVVPVNQGFSYYIFLTSTESREIKATKIAEDLDKYIQDKFGNNAKKEDQVFFDSKVSLQQTGGPVDDYQVTLAIKTDDLDKLKKASLEIGKTMQDKLCLEDNQVTVNDNCTQENKLTIKIDDGFTNKDNIIYDIRLNRPALLASGLGIPGRGPLSIAINNLIVQQYEFNKNEKITTVKLDNKDTEVIMEPTKVPTGGINEVLLSAVGGNTASINPAQLGEIVETKPKSSIERVRGQTVGLVKARIKSEYQNNQGIATQATQALVNYFNKDDAQKTKDLGLEKDTIGEFSDGQNADAVKSFSELGVALILAILVSYIVLAIFFNSLAQPMGILYTIPLALVGVMPALAIFVSGQFGFLEIIGLIILVGIVENVAIFLIDAANEKIKGEGWDDKRAISYAAGVRFKPVVLTSVTALVSLAPLAITSEFYRSISVVIMFGILASGVLSLITTPILFVFFRWLSNQFQKANIINKLSFILLPIVGVIASMLLIGNPIAILPLLLILTPVIYLIIWGIQDRPKKIAKSTPDNLNS